MRSFSKSDWYTPEARDAERKCDLVIDDAAATIRESDELLDEFHEELVVTQEDVDNFRALIGGRCRTPEWDAVISRIDHGELSWEGLLEGKRSTDPDVIAAFASLRSIEPLTPSPEHESDEGRVPATGNLDGKRAKDYSVHTDDEYFEEMDIFGKR